MKFPPSKTVILGILFIVFLFFIVYSLINSNPVEGMHGVTTPKNNLQSKVATKN
jgi:hypothetical protein